MTRSRCGHIGYGLLFASGVAVAQADGIACLDPAGPGAVFEAIRYEEQFCRRPATAGDPWWFRLKNMSLGDASASIGGELRTRLEDYRPVRAGLRGGRPDTYVTARALVHTDIQWGPWRAFGQIGYWDSFGRQGGPAPTDVDRGDVQQLFVEWRGDGFVRAGRQELLYGSGRLLGLRRSPNIRLTFDGARVGVPFVGGTLDLFHFRPVEIDPASWNNHENAGERIAGMYYARPPNATGLAFDVYAFRFERDFQRYQNAAGKDERNVAGVRLYGTAGRIDLNSELILQGGRTAGEPVRAWSLQNDFVFKVDEDANWSLGLKANAASGDDNAGDHTFETFQPIYAAPPYFMQSSLLTAANIANLQPYAEWRPRPSLTLTGELQVNWRMETGDGYYQPPLVVQPLDRRGHYLASQAGLSMEWQVHPDLLVEAWVSRFLVSNLLERAGGRDTTFVASMITWSF